MNIRDDILHLKDEITDYRREMHMHPQTAYEEEFASGLVREKLTEWGIPFESNIAKTGVVATIEGKENQSGKAIGLRADMDALDIMEDENKKWVSKFPGKMHGCGHDGHTAMLLGAAKYLSKNPNFDGKVHLIFQPAEEGRRGANAMIDEGLFRKFPCDLVFGLHNWPSLPRGTFATRPGPIMAATDNFEITVRGHGGHAARPQDCIDPVVIASHIITALQTIISRTRNPVEPAVISVTNFHAGTHAFNVIPDNAHLIGTVRTYNDVLRHELKEKIGAVATQIAGAMGAKLDYQYDFIIDPTINDVDAAETCASVAQKIFGPENVDCDVVPSMGGEDFGAMLMEVPGCYVLLGQGEPDMVDSPNNCGLHTPRYDFNDRIIPLGIEYWARLVEECLPLK